MIGGDAGNIAEIVREHSVGQHVAQRALIEVMVRVDEAGQHDHARRVDHGRVGADVRAHGGDPLVFDQHVGPLEIADGGIVAEHHAAFDQSAHRAALGDGRPRDAGERGRCQHRGGGCQQRAPVDSSRCRARRFGAVVTHGAFLPKRFLISKGPAPTMSKTTIVDKRPSRSCRGQAFTPPAPGRGWQ